MPCQSSRTTGIFTEVRGPRKCEEKGLGPELREMNVSKANHVLPYIGNEVGDRAGDELWRAKGTPERTVFR